MKTKPTQETAAQRYDEHLATIQELMKQISVGLQQHKRSAHETGSPHWGHVGDLTSIEESLADLRDRLHHLGEYQITY